MLLLATAAVTASAQTTVAEMLADTSKCAGVYTPYPDSVAQETPPPHGYEAFYVSHYGRHGSRYLIEDADYLDVLTAMRKAYEDSALTPLGIDVTGRLESTWREAEGRGGNLTPLGYRQHHDIASRLIKACPGAFAPGANVTATSTVIMRCAHSMFAFLTPIKEAFPHLSIPMESSWRHMHYMSYNNADAKRFNSTRGAWNDTLDNFRHKKIVPDRLISSLFIAPDAAASYMEPSKFMDKLYWIAVDLPNMECDKTLTDIFTPDELFDLWQFHNYEFYTRNSCNPINNGVFLESAKNLLQNILDTATQYVEQGRHGATLRFGHDSTIIPLAGLLRIPIASGCDSVPERLYLSYADWKVSPMASNFQMRLYKSTDNPGDIIVKFMLNENEIELPYLKTDIFPYYHWEDVNKAFKYILNQPVNLKSNN